MARKIIATLTLTSLTLYVLIVAALYLAQDKMVFPGPFVQTVEVDKSEFEKVFIPTEDGETLLAFYHPAKAGEATVIFFHGNADAAIYQKERAEILMQAGFGVLLVEYRGYPGSSGTPSEQGLFADGRAAYDYLVANGARDIALYAHSLGTGVAVKLASEREVVALVLEAPFDSALALAKARFPFAPAGLLLKHQFRSDLYIRHVRAPILILHGDRDRVVPIKHARKLLSEAPKRAIFEVLEGAGHIDLWRFGSIEKAATFISSSFKNSSR